MPLRLESGDELDDGLIHIREREQTFVFTGIASRPVPSLLRNFSAPVKLTASLETSDLKFLMANDCDPFNRWQAGQSYAIRLLIEAVKAIRAGSAPAPAAAYAQALGATLNDGSLEPAYRAAVLNLPRRIRYRPRDRQGYRSGCDSSGASHLAR